MRIYKFLKVEWLYKGDSLMKRNKVILRIVVILVVVLVIIFWVGMSLKEV